MRRSPEKMGRRGEHLGLTLPKEAKGESGDDGILGN